MQNQSGKYKPRKEAVMWFIILSLTFIACGAGVVFLITRFSKFHFIRNYAGENVLLQRGIAFGILMVIVIILWLVMRWINMAVVMLNLTGIWIICEIVFAILKKFSIDPNGGNVYFTGICAIFLTVVYLCFAFINARDIVNTNYSLETSKNVKPLRIVQFADSHLGTTFHAEEFEKEINNINLFEPDIVVITGDYVDDSSSYEDLVGCSLALSKLKTKYGVYFSFGNHDKGYYSSDRRGFTEEMLRNELEKNGVTILEDETVDISDDYVLIGRQDKSEHDRAPLSSLVSSVSPHKYSIVLDHQPNDYDSEEKACVDLVLSGHTHGGQLIPITKVGEWIKQNDATYGHEKRSNTDFIVTSGISDWSIIFKSGCVSEFTVIDIKQAQ